MRPPSASSSSTSNARSPMMTSRPACSGPAAYRCLPSTVTHPYLSAFARFHVTTSNRASGRASSALRSPRGQVGLAPAPAVVLLVGQIQAPSEQSAVEPRNAPHAGHRHEQLAPHRAHARLHAALLMPRIRVAERVLEPVVSLERLEQAGQTHPLERPAAHARGIVEHDPRRHAAQPLEDVAKRLARALRVLPGHQLARPDVRIREVQHEMTHARHLAPVPDVDLAEIGLRLARMPHQIKETGLALRGELAPERRDLPRHRRQRHLRPILVAQTLPYACGRMPLLAPRTTIPREPLLDHRHVPVDDRLRAPPPDRRPGRQVPGLQVLAHRRLADVLAARYRCDGLAVHPATADRLDFGHADHLPFRTSLTETKHHQDKAHGWSACLPAQTRKNYMTKTSKNN